ncbi:MAG: transglutaminase domain-containing protein [Planctomycetes bacterium]|nr:transglutaminase domain-containing protein [Planctomycetota bacterium]
MNLREFRSSSLPDRQIGKGQTTSLVYITRAESQIVYSSNSWKGIAVPLSLLCQPKRAKALLLCFFIVSVVIGAGCDQPTVAPPVAESVTTQSSESTLSPTVSSDVNSDHAIQRELIRESWELVSVSGAKVGYSHFEEFATQLGDQPVRELVSSNEISMQRFGQTVSQSIEARSVESLEGQVLRFGSKLLSGPSELTIKGEYRDGKMLIETGSLGKTQSSSLAWDPKWGGFFADQQSMKKSPMKPGEERTIVALFPGTAQAGGIELKAKQMESVRLLSEERELLRIESSMAIAGTKINSILWVDDAGEVLKMSVPGINHESFRTTKELALRPADKVEFDLGTQTVVKVEKPIRTPHATTRIVYRARLSNGSPSETFSNCRSQTVTKTGDRSAEIVVRAIRPKSEVIADSDSGEPTEADVQPNNLIQSDDGAIVRLAERFGEGVTDPWELAMTFEAGVRDYVHSKNFSQAISSAADVVRSGEGDCTEHAVLLAALCRAKGIPARVAIGLVYYGPVQGFAYHMWNEVWIADGWVPIDATLGLGGIGAGHIKIADSDLNSASPVSALLPVVEVLGQLELDIVSVE